MNGESCNSTDIERRSTVPLSVWMYKLWWTGQKGTGLVDCPGLLVVLLIYSAAAHPNLSLTRLLTNVNLPLLKLDRYNQLEILPVIVTVCCLDNLEWGLSGSGCVLLWTIEPNNEHNWMAGTLFYFLCQITADISRDYNWLKLSSWWLWSIVKTYICPY